MTFPAWVFTVACFLLGWVFAWLGFRTRLLPLGAGPGLVESWTRHFGRGGAFGLIICLLVAAIFFVASLLAYADGKGFDATLEAIVWLSLGFYSKNGIEHASKAWGQRKGGPPPPPAGPTN